MDSVRESTRETPIVREVDVVVVGGGPAGIMAALAAARSGARTLLIERFASVGGMVTSGLMNSINGFRNEHPPDYVQTVHGYAQELVDRLLAAGGAGGFTAHSRTEQLTPGSCPYAVAVDPEIFERVALEMLDEAGVALVLHAWFSDALGEGRRIEAAVIEDKSGRGAVRGRLFVDATGDGDVAARAGASFDRAAKHGKRMMPMQLMLRVTGLPAPGPDERRLWINGVTTRWGPAVEDVDGSDAADLTRAEIEARRAVADHMIRLRERFPEATLVESAAVIGVRETRRIRGLCTISEDDCLSGRAFEDSIAVSSNPVPRYYGKRRFFDHLGFEIPYRSLVPRDLDNLLLSGRCISACQPAFQSARSIAPNMAISQAAGTAAGLCTAGGCLPAELDVAALQDRLESEGAVVRIPPGERT